MLRHQSWGVDYKLKDNFDSFPTLDHSFNDRGELALVTDEPVRFEKYPVEFIKTSGKYPSL